MDYLFRKYFYKHLFKLFLSLFDGLKVNVRLIIVNYFKLAVRGSNCDFANMLF